jgi:hypothetical protein
MIESPKGTSWIDSADIVKAVVTALAGALIAAIIAFARWLKGAFWSVLIDEMGEHCGTKAECSAIRKRLLALERRADLASDEKDRHGPYHHREGDQG